MIWTDNPLEFAQNRIDSRQYILLPRIGELLDRFKARKVLDYGCGEGYLGRYISNKALKIGIFDISEVMIQLAEDNLKIEGFQDVESYVRSTYIPNSEFDCAVLSLVLMTIGDDHEYLSVLANCNRALSTDGFLIVGITHPCFRNSLFSTHHTEYTLEQRFDYFDNHRPFDVYLRTSQSERHLNFKDFHHNLTYLFSAFSESQPPLQATP